MEIGAGFGYRYRMMTRHLAALTFCLVYSAAGITAECMSETEGMRSMEEKTITLLNDNGKPVSFEVLVADDQRERAAGFQHICPDVIDQTLILFIYPGELRGRFHMQNVHAPLDIAFFDRRGTLLKQELMQTYTEDSKPLYGPSSPFQYALEARQGFFAEIGLSAYPSRLLLAQ